MKLHLPTLLLGAIIACMATQGLQANVLASTPSAQTIVDDELPEIAVPNTVKLENVEITPGEIWGDYVAPGTAAIVGENLTLNSNLSSKEEVKLTWTDSAEFTTLTLSGNGTMQKGEFKIFASHATSTFTIEKGIKFTHTDLLVGWDGSDKQTKVIFNGEFSSGTYTDSDGESYTTYIGIGKNGSIDFTEATLNAGKKVEIHLNGGTMIRANHRVTQNHTLVVEFDSAFTGNLNIGTGGILSIVDQAVGGISQIAVSGELNFADNSIIQLEYMTPSVDEGYSSDTDYVYSVESGTVIATAASITGDLSTVKLTTLTNIYDEAAETDTDTFGTLDNMKLIAVHTGEHYELMLSSIVSGDEIWTDGSITINKDGSVTEALSDKNVVWLANAEASVNVVGAGDLSAEFIRGTDGSLITASTQTLTISGKRIIAYDVIGADDASGAMLVIGTDGGTFEENDITLAGGTYLSKDVKVLSGSLTISEGTTVGFTSVEDTTTPLSEGGEIVTLIDSVFVIGNTVTESIKDSVYVSTDTKKVALVTNNGTIDSNVTINSDANLQNKSTGIINGTVSIENDGVFNNNGIALGDVSAKAGATITGSGAFNGTTILEANSTLNVGDGAGFQSFNELEINADATLNFTIAGDSAATANNQGSGYYSNMTVKSLNLAGDATANLIIDANIMALNSNDVELNLIVIDTDLDGEPIISGTGELITKITDDDTLLEAGSESFIWDAATGTLTFTATINGTVVSKLVSGDRINVANTLWTSTSVVKSFAKHALSQASTSNVGDTNIWGSGLGDFMDMSGSNGFSFSSGGYAIGVDQVVSEGLRLGISLGQTFGKFTSDDGQLKDDQKSIMLAIYSQYKMELSDKQSIGLSSYFAYGSVDNSSTSRIANNANLAGKADWSDTVFSFGTKLEWTFNMNDGLSLTPFIGIDFIHASQDDFTESYGATSRRFSNGKMQQWSVPIGLTIKKAISMDNGQSITPELTIAYIGDVSRNTPSVSGIQNGVTAKSEGTSPGRHAMLLNVGANYGISKNWSASAFYTLEVRSEQKAQNATLSASYSF